MDCRICYTFLFLLVHFCLYSQSDITNGLISYHPLNGDAKDLSGNCMHGIVHGANATKDRNGIFKGAMAFDGQRDFIEILDGSAYDFSNEQDFAISLWVKIAKNQIDRDTTDNDIISKWVIDDSSDKHLKTGYAFAIRIINKKLGEKENNLYASQFGGYSGDCNDGTGLQSKNTLDPNRYHHIIFTVKSSRFYLYIDGELVMRKGSNTFCATENSASLRIGKRGGAQHQNYFAGSIDELIIYNRSLDIEEIKVLADPNFDLREQLGKKRLDRSLVLNDTLFFDENIFELSTIQKEKLKNFTKLLESSDKYAIEIEGHTNGIPSHNFCDELSIKRALVVEDYLLSIGINCLQISSLGKGKRFNIASNKTNEGRRKNQRVELKLYRLILP